MGLFIDDYVPSIFDAGGSSMNEDVCIMGYNVNPVINLKSNIEVIGNGTYSNPYEIKM